MVEARASDRCEKVEQECLDRIREQHNTAAIDKKRATKRKKCPEVVEETDDEDGFC